MHIIIINILNIKTEGWETFSFERVKDASDFFLSHEKSLKNILGEPASDSEQ